MACSPEKIFVYGKVEVFALRNKRSDALPLSALTGIFFMIANLIRVLTCSAS